jgi:type IV pilus assembly protein PilC
MAATAPKKEVRFVYEGKNKQGTKKTCELIGTSEAAVKAILRKQGILPTKVKVKKEKPRLLFGGEKRIETADIVLFIRQLVMMMREGIPLPQSLKIIGQNHKKLYFRRLVMDIEYHIETGETMANAFRYHLQYFDPLICKLVDAGEAAGTLKLLLATWADYQEKNERINKRIQQILNYPLVALAVSVILLMAVVPVFADQFHQSGGGELPDLTQLVFNLSDFMLKNWGQLLITLVVANIVFGQAKIHSVKFQEFLQRLSLVLPLFGELLITLALARFTRILAALIATGTYLLLEALDFAAIASKNSVFYEATMKIKEDMADGITLAESLRNMGIFPNEYIQMIQIGEESRSLAKRLIQLADDYEAKVDVLVESVNSIMIAITMIFFGVVMGVLVLAMSPIISKIGGI